MFRCVCRLDTKWAYFLCLFCSFLMTPVFFEGLCECAWAFVCSQSMFLCAYLCPCSPRFIESAVAHWPPTIRYQHKYSLCCDITTINFTKFYIIKIVCSAACYCLLPCEQFFFNIGFGSFLNLVFWLSGFCCICQIFRFNKLKGSMRRWRPNGDQLTRCRQDKCKFNCINCV